MRSCSTFAVRGYPSFKCHYRLHPCCLHKCLSESVTAPGSLHVEGYDAGFGVVCQVFEEVGAVQVHGISVANDLAEGHVSQLADGEELLGEGAALRDHSHRPRLGRCVGDEGQTGLRALHSHAVGADEVDPVAGDLLDFVLEGLPLRQAGLAEAGREDVGSLNSFGDAVGQHVRDIRCRHRDDNVVDLFLDVQDTGVALPTMEFAVLGIDQEQAVP